MEAARDDLYRRIREELYTAKVLVRSSRNHTKTTAAAMQDSEERLDALLAELDAHTDPHAQRRHRDNGKAEQHDPSHHEREGRLEGAIG